MASTLQKTARLRFCGNTLAALAAVFHLFLSLLPFFPIRSPFASAATAAAQSTPAGHGSSSGALAALPAQQLQPACQGPSVASFRCSPSSLPLFAACAAARSTQATLAPPSFFPCLQLGPLLSAISPQPPSHRRTIRLRAPPLHCLHCPLQPRHMGGSLSLAGLVSGCLRHGVDALPKGQRRPASGPPPASTATAPQDASTSVPPPAWSEGR
jgi:hypothetical protein